MSGPAGVGKSRLAREVLAEAEREGWATLAIRGSAGLAGVPLGAFRTVMRLPSPSDLSELTDSVAHELASMRSAKGLVVWVDCQDLDESSAGLLHQVVAADLIVAIITSRAGTHPPAALTDLWTDGFAERIELQNLSRRETTELLVAGLGGSVQDSSANRIWQVTAGNPLYLREVVLSSSETGALRQVDGEWRWKGEWATGARLQEIVATRLGRLDPDQLTAVELLATAGWLPLGLVTGLTTVRAVQELETRGLVTTQRSGRRLEVALEHPLHAEVLRSGMPPLQQRSIRHNLVAALLATGARRTADRVRLACWSIESGLEVDPMTLSFGTDASLFVIGHAIAGRLSEILPDLSVAIPSDGPAVRQDHEVAVRLARAAYEQTGALSDGVALATTLSWTGATADAEAVLAELAAQAGSSIDDRIRVALALAWLRFWAHYRVDQARAGLTELAAEAPSVGCDPALLAEIYQELAGIALNTAQPAAALAYAEQSAAAQGVAVSRSLAAPAAAAALAYLGRCGEAMALVDDAVPASLEGSHTLTVAQLLFARAAALARMGDLDDARQLLEWLREVALADELLDSTAAFGVVLGEILLRQGRAATAGRIFLDSSGLLAERDLFGYRPWALSGLSRARALSGERESAVAALDEARRTQPIGRHFDMCHYLADVELHSLAGRTGDAVQAARNGVAWARAAGMIGDEAQCLEAWLRVAPSAEIAERLTDLTGLTDSKLVGALADHARAVVASDPDALLAVSERFAEMSAWRLAAEAAAGAAGIFDRRHESRAAKAAARAAAGYADRCDGMRTPAAAVSSGPVRLTKREREIATLAASGLSSKEIAVTMYLSPRTVENHLYHAYVKLGVTDRAGLAAALSPSSPE
jgi:DNA-binding CsgD family transcriptional regulator